MTLVRIGRLGRAHGLGGEVVLEGTALTDRELEQVGSFTWRGASGEVRSLTLEAVRSVTGGQLVRFAGIGDRDQAAALTRGVLFVEGARLPDPGPGVAYTFQLIGLEVVTEAGRRLGVLETVMESGAHPIYVVRGDKELLIPATPQVVRDVDFAARRITVTLPAGLEDL
jgi:16S rRNA processing protein RimM